MGSIHRSISQKNLNLGQVKVVNKLGGGGLIGTNTVYHAKPDGLTVGNTPATGDVLDQILHREGVHFNVMRFAWLGRPDKEMQMLVTRAYGPCTDMGNLMALKGHSKLFHVLTPERGSSAYDIIVMDLNAFGIPFSAASPFRGSHDATAAFLSRVGDGLAIPAVNARKLGKGFKVILMTSGGEETFK